MKKNLLLLTFCWLGMVEHLYSPSWFDHNPALHVPTPQRPGVLRLAPMNTAQGATTIASTAHHPQATHFAQVEAPLQVQGRTTTPDSSHSVDMRRGELTPGPRSAFTPVHQSSRPASRAETARSRSPLESQRTPSRAGSPSRLSRVASPVGAWGSRSSTPSSFQSLADAMTAPTAQQWAHPAPMRTKLRASSFSSTDVADVAAGLPTTASLKAKIGSPGQVSRATTPPAAHRPRALSPRRVEVSERSRSDSSHSIDISQWTSGAVAKRAEQDRDPSRHQSVVSLAGRGSMIWRNPGEFRRPSTPSSIAASSRSGSTVSTQPLFPPNMPGKPHPWAEPAGVSRRHSGPPVSPRAALAREQARRWSTGFAQGAPTPLTQQAIAAHAQATRTQGGVEAVSLGKVSVRPYQFASPPSSDRGSVVLEDLGHPDWHPRNFRAHKSAYPEHSTTYGPYSPMHHTRGGGLERRGSHDSLPDRRYPESTRAMQQPEHIARAQGRLAQVGPTSHHAHAQENLPFGVASAISQRRSTKPLASTDPRFAARATASRRDPAAHTSAWHHVQQQVLASAHARAQAQHVATASQGLKTLFQEMQQQEILPTVEEELRIIHDFLAVHPNWKNASQIVQVIKPALEQFKQINAYVWRQAHEPAQELASMQNAVSQNSELRNLLSSQPQEGQTHKIITWVLQWSQNNATSPNSVLPKAHALAWHVGAAVSAALKAQQVDPKAYRFTIRDHLKLIQAGILGFSNKVGDLSSTATILTEVRSTSLAGGLLPDLNTELNKLHQFIRTISEYRGLLAHLRKQGMGMEQLQTQK